jgi:hypothetical protein
MSTLTLPWYSWIGEIGYPKVILRAGTPSVLPLCFVYLCMPTCVYAYLCVDRQTHALTIEPELSNSSIRAYYYDMTVLQSHVAKKLASWEGGPAGAEIARRAQVSRGPGLTLYKYTTSTCTSAATHHEAASSALRGATD